MNLSIVSVCYDFAMVITYSSHHRWIKQVPVNPFDSFGQKQRSKLQDALSRITTLPIRSDVAELDESFLARFMPLYESRLSTMKNPAHSDIWAKTLGIKERTYFSLSLWEDDVFLGGTIFRVVGEELRIAYRVYEHDWERVPLQVSPSMYTEYLITKYAHEHDIRVISHGKDRNPYGPNASIGLASFKLSVGCRPEQVNNVPIHTLDTDSLTEDAFILEYPGDMKHAITHAYLVISRENEYRWTQVTKYPKQLTVTTLYRETVGDETSRA